MNPTRDQRLFALVAAFVAGIGMLFGCGGDVDVVAFGDKMPDYVSAPVSGGESPRPVIRPRMVVVEPRTGGMDTSVFGDLPEDLRATATAGVGTVVRTRWQNDLMGRWTTGNMKYAYFCEVTVIDWRTKQVVVKKDFEGEDTVSSDGEESPSSHRFAVDVTEEIGEYLAGLPRR